MILFKYLCKKKGLLGWSYC